MADENPGTLVVVDFFRKGIRARGREEEHESNGDEEKGRRGEVERGG